MAIEQSLQRYKDAYAKLLRLYPDPYYDRFGESMEQTFGDLLREHAKEGRIFVHAVDMFLETFIVIIRENLNYMALKNKRLIGILLVVVALLCVPLILMQFREDVVWTLSDFIFAAILLGGTGITMEAALRATRNTAYRLAFAMGLAGAFLLVWINGAVGIIGSENNPANLLYGIVLIIGFFGSIISLFKAEGMARTLFAAAIAQALVPVAALIIWSPKASFVAEAPGIVGVFVLNAFFVALFTGSGMLFRKSLATV